MAKKDNKSKNKDTDNKKDAPMISIILLCDLPGYRMKSYGPTSLININGKYLIDIQIDTIKRCFSNYEIIMCVGFDTEKISKHIRNKYNKINIRLVENQLYNTCNSCEAVRLAINNTLNDRLLICDGSLLVNKKALSLIDINSNCVLIENSPSENLEIGININPGKEAQHFSFGAYKTWSEILHLRGTDSIEQMRKFLNHVDSKKKFIFESLNDLLKNKHTIRCIENKFPIYKISNIKTYHHIKENHEIFNI